MPLSITQEVEEQYFLLSGNEGELPSRQARAIIKVMAAHIERQDNHIRKLEDRVAQLQNTDYFVKRYLLVGKEEEIDKENLHLNVQNSKL